MPRNRLTPDDHFIGEMLYRLANSTINKFHKGKKEHGGHIWEKDILWLCEQAQDEFMDGYTYIYPVMLILAELLKDPEVVEKVKKIQKNLTKK